MKTIDISTSGSNSRVLFGFDWRKVETILPVNSNIVIITDDNIRDLYGKEFPPFPVLSVKPGEESKSLSTLGALVEDLLKLGIDRNGFILGIGGGVVCDITGFLASIYMRGIKFGFISTSLLSQVDASIGGKNGVNSNQAKNIIGVFNHPEFVICDNTMLSTLPNEEYLSGLSELVKAAMIKDFEMVQNINANCQRVLSRDVDLLNSLIYSAVQIKKDIVQEDERESGIRKLLNFGHTFGHAAEAKYGVRHGIAVAWGMIAALELSFRKGYLGSEDKLFLSEIISKLGLVQGAKIKGTDISDFISNDKKKSGDFIDFVFLQKPGNSTFKSVPLSELKIFIRTF